MANIGEMKFGIQIVKCDECDYKRDASLRDNLLVTAGARAAYMHSSNVIDIPGALEGEDNLAIFLARAVDYYLEFECGNFDNYIEEVLLKEYSIAVKEY